MDLEKLRPFVPAARYAFVIVTGLFLFTASTNYLSTAALEQIQAVKATPAPKPAVVRMPDPPVAVAPPAARPALEPAAPPKPDTTIASTPTPSPTEAGEESLIAVAATPQTLPPADMGLTVTDASQPVANAGLPPIGGGQATHVVQTAVNFRAAPSNAGARLGVLQGGEQVTVTAEDGGWMQVEENGVVLGWVYGSFLSSL